MGVKFDFSDIEKAIKEVRTDVRKEFTRLGSEGVAYARRYGSYKDRTGRLRSSNRFEATEDHLVLKNDAPYATNVEHRGYDVLSGAFLETARKLNK